ncbi:MAG: DEAD/DEAH box helicase [Desulfurococcaceae archaeon]
MLIDELVKWGLPLEYVNLLGERGIRELNPVQVEAVKRGLLNGVNMVISAPTASGKTLIAEMVLVKTAVNGLVGVYLTPLRALASEKYAEFSVLNKIGVKVGITTGDYDQPAEYLGEYDIIVATYERFDSLMRLKPTWLKRVGLIVIDEMHNVNDPERGPIIEMIVARALKRGTRIIGLSATIGNPAELARWVKGELVTSAWRPVKLVEGVFNKKRSEIVFADGRKESVEEDHDEAVVNLVLHNIKRNYQTLVFVHNRKRVEELAEITATYITPMDTHGLEALLDELESAPTRIEKEFLRELGFRGVAFHHAGLSQVSRRVVEEAFRKRLLKVVYATPTLAAGVNLPARRVLISIKRYDPAKGRKVNISVSEYKQMAGRAGRPQFDEMGESIIVDASNIDEGFKYITSEPEPVQGRLLGERSLRVHVLSAVASLEVSSIGDLSELFKLTFSASTGKLTNINEQIEDLVDFLEGLGMVARREPGVVPTRLGRITAYSYLDPLTVNMFFRYKGTEYRDLYILHLVSLTPDFLKSGVYIPGKVMAAYEELAEVYASSGLLMPTTSEYYDYDDWLHGFIYALALQDWINERSEDEIVEKYALGPGDIYNLKDTASWITGALGKVAGVIGDVVYHRKLTALSQRLDKGVKQDALELASLKYIGRVRARILIEHGIKTLEDLAKTPKKKLMSLPSFGPKVAEEVYKQLHELGYSPRS